MSATRRIGLFIIIAGLLILATSGYFYRGDASRRAEIQDEKATLEDSVRRVHEEIVKTSLKYRGFQTSLPDMPDSTQKYAGRQVMDIGEGYNKTIRRLEFQERDIKLEISSLEREAARERATARARALPVAAAGAGASVVGIVLLALSRRRVVA